ncbi:MAG TPA: hypothetical protein VKU19_42870 [Bryobacteraceae bacterium]|nr:hypothetical protein [Bryobacteraceae bacterium]
MPLPPFASWMLEQEARALLTRLARVKPLAMQESMLPAASLLPETQTAIERFLIVGRWQLRSLVERFLDWLKSPEGAGSDAETAQRKFISLRLRFTGVLTHFDLFENVITQRSENETGVWLSGLDVVSADALRLHGHYYDSPPIVCYLDRGMGAAIRRSRTRLPGGGDNPVAIIKIPRERMVGSGIASSLVHEVGHQAAALLSLVESLRPVLRRKAQERPSERLAWELWERWIGEIVADLWAAGRVGIASTLGLMSVVSLPRVFVFRVNTGDPHPTPWIRVKLSAAMGNAFYPQPGWGQLVELWESYYPRSGAAPQQREVMQLLERTIPELVTLLVDHRPPALRGHSVRQALDTVELQPSRLQELLRRWRHAPQEMYQTRPIVTFAAIGQGRIDGSITPEEESAVLGKLLSHWALWSTLQAAAGCAIAS